MKLSDLSTGRSAVIVSVAGAGAFRKRIIEMGFVRGKTVTAIRNAPLNDPIEYKIMDYFVSLRREEAHLVEVADADSDEAKKLSRPAFSIADGGAFATQEHPEPKIVKVALVGNPNCGKTTLYNYLCGTNEHTGNYSGVTIGAATNSFTYGNYIFEFVDLPGTYSISAYSPEETFVRNKLLTYDPDVVLNVVDSTNLARNLYLTTQLIDMGERMVMALNMYDDFEKSGDQLDFDQLGKMIGIAMAPTVGSKGTGTKALLDKIIQVYEGEDIFVRRVHINYGELEMLIVNMINLIDKNCHASPILLSRFVAIKVIENDLDFVRENVKCADVDALINELVAMRDHAKEMSSIADLETYVTDLRYSFIDGALNETYKPAKRSSKQTLSQRLDNIFTHRVWGIPIFFLVIWIMFECTFKIGQYPMDWIDMFVSWFSDLVSSSLPDGPVRDLLVDGIISGCGGVLVFLPNILILFLFISFMEDTGYMARAAFIMDKMMHKMGLHGKSFIPLIMGFGCNVPAIMATRTIEDRNNRMLTMLIIPLMSCSARLPVYILFCGAFFPENAGNVLFSIYILGIVLAIIMCRLFKRTLFNTQDLPFVMELPQYRMPTLRTTLLNMWSKAKQYLQKMGGIIMVASIIVWFLGYYPKSEEIEKNYASAIENIERQTFASAEEHGAAVDSVEIAYRSAAQEYSLIGRMGRVIEPVIRPLGFDWKMGVSLVAGVAAKEIVVSTLAVLYHSDDEDASLMSNIYNEKRNGERFFTKANVLSFMTFTLIYFPCLATLTAIKNEAGHWNDFHMSKRRRRKVHSPWRWSLFVVGYTTVLAWVVSWLVYNILK